MLYSNNAACAMNGKYLLDTNAVIDLLNGQSGLSSLLQQANWVGISVVTELEFCSFPNISPQDIRLFQAFKSRVEVLDLSSSDLNLIQKTIEIRCLHRNKLPDSIIAATSILQGATLLSNDMGFQKITGLRVQGF